MPHKTIGNISKDSLENQKFQKKSERVFVIPKTPPLVQYAPLCNIVSHTVETDIHKSTSNHVITGR